MKATCIKCEKVFLTKENFNVKNSKCVNCGQRLKEYKPNKHWLFTFIAVNVKDLSTKPINMKHENDMGLLQDYIDRGFSVFGGKQVRNF